MRCALSAVGASGKIEFRYEVEKVCAFHRLRGETVRQPLSSEHRGDIRRTNAERNRFVDSQRSTERIQARRTNPSMLFANCLMTLRIAVQWRFR